MKAGNHTCLAGRGHQSGLSKLCLVGFSHCQSVPQLCWL